MQDLSAAHLVVVAVSVLVVWVLPSGRVSVLTTVAICRPFLLGWVSTQIFAPVAETTPHTCPSFSVFFSEVQLCVPSGLVT
ncbi:hypothetical protein D3C78_1583620 [compost metagenome]